MDNFVPTPGSALGMGMGMQAAPTPLGRTGTTRTRKGSAVGYSGGGGGHNGEPLIKLTGNTFQEGSLLATRAATAAAAMGSR